MTVTERKKDRTPKHVWVPYGDDVEQQGSHVRSFQGRLNKTPPENLMWTVSASPVGYQVITETPEDLQKKLKTITTLKLRSKIME